MQEIEIWKPVPNYENYYVSNFGNAKSTKGYKKLRLGKPGYYRFTVSANSKKVTLNVHRVVGILFVKGYKRGLMINHLDGNKLNNHYSNLKWDTPQDNAIHALHVLKVGRHAFKKVQCVETGQEYESIKQAYEDKGYTYGLSHVGEMMKGIRKNKTTLIYL